MNRFRKGTGAKLPRFALVFALLAMIITAYELYGMIVPFKSQNPLWTQVTIGQPIIDNWSYQGQDEEGYLKFYNQSQSIVLPPTAKIFSADGRFVVIEGFSPNSFTYALPFEAIPMSWLLAGTVVITGGGWLLLRRSRRRTALSHSKMNFNSKMRFRGKNRTPHMDNSMMSKINLPKRNARFRPRPSRSGRFKR
ncbi:hypothetical protein [Alicyclobacillus sp. SO9]|uniref:hypothetical protein n=1 Tax=Alicyclobacillus sp. SO9 TaxID=2665646 RepID=UPI001E416FE6|nr:hypothetical protein [Alicyclobacillus sp. SO9]